MSKWIDEVEYNDDCTCVIGADPDIYHAKIPAGVTEIGAGAFRDCRWLLGVQLPAGVTKIGKEAFLGCTNLGSLQISSGAEKDDASFYDLSRAGIMNLPDSLTEIGDGAFMCCCLLIKVIIPNRVTEIGNDAFRGCHRLKSLRLPDGLTVIGDFAFWDCRSLESLLIPERVTKIGDYAFSGCCGLESINIPAGVTEIGCCAFRGCSGLKSLNIPAGVTKIAAYAFNDCFALETVHIPEGVIEIGSCAFRGCRSLKSLSLPESVTKISDYAFSECRALEEVYIPESVTEIGAHAFSGCYSLKTLPDPLRGEHRTARISGQSAELSPDEARDNTSVRSSLRKSYAEKRVGERFEFGRWPQGENGEVKPVLWRVLRREADHLLVISEYCLDWQPYHEVYCDAAWEDCSIRRWLNGEFCGAAFNEPELGLILSGVVSNAPDPDTEDRVFLLSYYEAGKWFADDDDRRAEPTAFAVKNGVEAGYCCWWLRLCHSEPCWLDVDLSAAYVYSDGSVGLCSFECSSVAFVSRGIGVRPALKLAF